MKTDFIPFDPLATIKLLEIITNHGAKNFRIRDYKDFLSSTKPLGTNRRIHYEDNPLLAIIDRLSSPDWLKFIVVHPKKEVLSKILNQLANRIDIVDQLDAYFQDEGRIARQLILIWAHEGNIEGQTIHQVTSEGVLQLPPYWSAPLSIEYVTKTQDEVTNFLNDVLVFWSVSPWHVKRESYDLFTPEEIAEEFSDDNEKPFIPKRKAPSFSFVGNSNRSMAIKKDSIVQALGCLENIVSNPAERYEDQVCEFIIIAGIFFGRDFKKVLKVALSDEGKGRLFICEKGLHLRSHTLNNKEEETKKNLQEEFLIPWNSILKDRIKRILEQKEDSQYIHNLLGKEAQDIFYKYFREKFGLGKNLVDQFSRLLNHAHMNYGSLRFGFPVPYISIIQGKPFGWTRGVCAYAGIRSDQLSKFQRLIENEILTDAGIKIDPVDCDSDDKDSKIAGSWHEPIEKVIQETISQLEEATTRNQVLFLTNKFFLIIGKRRRNIHYHTSHYIQRYPNNILMIRDKIIAGRVPVRVLAFSLIIKKLAEKIPSYIKSGELAYSQGGKSMRWTDLDYKKRKAIENKFINSDHPEHSIRRSFVNFLLQNGFGEVPAYSMTGHSPAIVQQGGTLTLQAPIDLWRNQEKILEKLFERIGLNKLLDLLLLKAEQTQAWKKILQLRNDFQIKEITRPGEKKFLRHDFSNYLPTFKSFEIEKKIRENISFHQRIDAAHQLVIQLTLDYHIPINYWLSYHHYTTLNSFIFTDSNEVYFKLLLQQDDAGGIGTAPLHLGSRNEPRVQRVLEIYKKIFTQANQKLKNKNSNPLKWNLFWKDNKLSQESLENKLLSIICLKTPKTKLTGKEIFTAFSEVSIYQCFVNHPGVIASCLAQRQISSLNNSSLEDVIKMKENHPAKLFDIEGNLYFEDLTIKATSREQSKKFQKEMAILPFEYGYSDIYPTVEKYARGLSLTQISRQLQRFESFQEPDRSGLAASLMIKKIRINGFSVPAKAFPIFIEAEFEKLVKTTTRKIEESDFPHPSLNAELKNLFLLCVASGARVSEIYNLHRADVKIINNQFYLNIRGGKTKSAERWICLTEFDWAKKFLPDLSLKKQENFVKTKKNRSYDRIKQNYLFPNLHLWFKFIYSKKETSLKNTGISRKLKNLLQGSYKELFPHNTSSISIHIFRHCYALYSLQEIIRKHYWHGNFNSALCSLATQMGHSSFIPTVFSYLGTGCMALDFSDK